MASMIVSSLLLAAGAEVESKMEELGIQRLREPVVAAEEVTMAVVVARGISVVEVRVFFVV